MRWIGFAGKGPNLTLPAAELPGGPWLERAQRRVKLGKGPSSSPAARRAGDAGQQTSWRSYQWPQVGADCWLQVSPMLDAGDADEAVASISLERFVANRKFAGIAGPSERVMAPDVPGVRGIEAFEHPVSMPGGPHRSLVLWFAVGRYVVAGCLAGPAATVTWAWLAEVAALQAAALPD